MSQPHRQCAGVIIQNERGEILFLEQQKSVYGIPGGIVEAGETPPIAALREALEEACIEVELEYIIGCYLLVGAGKTDNLATIYKAKVIKGIPKPGDTNEVKNVLWRSPNDLPLPLVTDAKAAIEDLLENKRGVVRTCQRTKIVPNL